MICCILCLVRVLSFSTCSSFNSTRIKRNAELRQGRSIRRGQTWLDNIQSVDRWLYPSELVFISRLVFMSWCILIKTLTFCWPSKSCHQRFDSSITVSLLCSEHAYSGPELLTLESEFYSMILHTWTNIRVPNCSLIHCYYQTLDIVLKFTLVQQFHPTSR